MPHHRHPAADVGHRALRAARGRDKGDTASCLALPCAERGGDGAVVAVLLQGVADGRRVARGADRQAERRHHHLPVVPVSEGTGQPAGGGGRTADNGRKHPYVTEISTNQLLWVIRSFTLFHAFVWKRQQRSIVWYISLKRLAGITKLSTLLST